VRDTSNPSLSNGQEPSANVVALPTGAVDFTLAEQLEDIAKSIEQLQTTAILEIAKHLAKARQLFRYRRDKRGFGGWVEARLSLSRQTAYNLLHVLEQFGDEESVKHFDTFPDSILYLLAAPSTPEAARTEIIERAEAGEKFSRAKVKDTIKNANEAEQALEAEGKAELEDKVEREAKAAASRQRKREDPVHIRRRFDQTLMSIRESCESTVDMHLPNELERDEVSVAVGSLAASVELIDKLITKLEGKPATTEELAPTAVAHDGDEIAHKERIRELEHGSSA
jgi:Protein of unknown function (DUF3102)